MTGLFLFIASVCSPSIAYAQTCELSSESPGQSNSFSAYTGFEAETPLQCASDILPAKQSHAVLRYFISFARTGNYNSQNYYTLKVRVNGAVVRTIADHKAITIEDFAGVTPDCITPTGSAPSCLYEKSFEVIIPLSVLPPNGQNQIEIVSAASTSDQSALEGAIIEGSIHYNFRLAIQQSEFYFIPRDANDSASECAIYEGYCYPIISARLVRREPMEGDADISGRIRFRLVFPKPHLAGTSSNAGSGSGPDYEINPVYSPPTNPPGSTQNLSIFRTEIPVLRGDGSYVVETEERDFIGAAVKITSRDFGGRARVLAEFVFQDNTTMAADIVTDANLTPSPVPSCLTEAQFTFATLPVDQDCDEIADAWEAEAGEVSSANKDAEPGSGGPHVGDGYSAHDEYRGFHYLQAVPNAGPTVVWSRTDAKQVKDVFFWDASGFNITGFVNAILGNQGALLKIREVNSEQANSSGTTNTAIPWVLPLAKHSINQSSRSANALVYLSVNGVLQGEEVANANGFSMDGKPILFDSSRIADSVAFAHFDSDFFYSFTLAHEAGHKFHLYHPEREGCGKTFSCTHTSAPTPLTSLGLDQYAINPSDNNELFLKIRYYVEPNPPVGSPPRTFAVHRGFITAGLEPSYPGIESPGYALDPTGNLEHVNLLNFNPRIITNLTIVRVFEQVNSFMDWSPSLEHIVAALIQFNQEQRQAICVHGGSCSL